MFTEVHELIEVIGIYQKSGFVPKKFQWRDKTYLVDEVTAVAEIRDGETKQRRYSVLVGGNVYRLLFHRDREVWWLEEVYCD